MRRSLRKRIRIEEEEAESEAGGYNGDQADAKRSRDDAEGADDDAEESKDSDQKEDVAAAATSSASAAAAAAASASASAVMLPARAELPECELCREPLESSEAAGSESTSRVPRLLPCGHCYCSACLNRMLEQNDNVMECPQRCAFEHELRIDSASKLPKNFALIKLTEQAAARSAQLELGVPPCQQCDSDQPRQAATIYCNNCRAYLCGDHDKVLHSISAFQSHACVTLSEKAQQRQAATRQKKLLEQAAAPFKEKLKEYHKNLVQMGEDNEKLIPTLQQKHQEHGDEQTAIVAKLRQFTDQLKRRFQEQHELLESGHRDLVAHHPQIARLQAAIHGLLRGSDLEVATRGEAMRQQCSKLLDNLAEATAQAEPRALPSGDSLVGGLQMQLLASTILQPHHAADLQHVLGGISLEHARLLYRATRDGFKANQLWDRCAGKGPTLTLVKVAGNGFICGAYTPVSWPANAASREGSVADPSGRTFLFSLANRHGRAVKLRLKDGEHGSALNLGSSPCGPGFGGCNDGNGVDNDLRLMWSEAADEPRGCFVRPSSFELDQEAEAAADLPPIPFRYDRKLLAGRDGESNKWVEFAAAEIEVYQL